MAKGLSMNQFMKISKEVSVYIQFFWRICLLKASPQDVPYSFNLLGFVLLAYFILGYSFISQAQGMLTGLWQMILLAGLYFTFVAVVLALHKKSTRFLQTMIAFLACNTLLSLLSLVIFTMIVLAKMTNLAWLDTFGQLCILLVMVWFLVVAGHIFRHALSSSFLKGLLMALFMTVLNGFVFHAITTGF